MLNTEETTFIEYAGFNGVYTLVSFWSSGKTIETCLALGASLNDLLYKIDSSNKGFFFHIFHVVSIVFNVSFKQENHIYFNRIL